MVTLGFLLSHAFSTTPTASKADHACTANTAQLNNFSQDPTYGCILRAFSTFSFLVSRQELQLGFVRPGTRTLGLSHDMSHPSPPFKTTYVNPGSVIGTSVTFIILGTAVVSGRFVVRRVKRSFVGLDDWFALAALVYLMILHVRFAQID